MRKCSLATSTFVLLLLISQSLFAADLQRRQAKRIHDRLTGVPPSESVLNEMEDRMSNPANSHYDPFGRTAADLAISDPAFYNVTLKNWTAPWTNEEQTIFTPLNDYTATVIGMVRDDVDFRELLFGDIIYTGATSSLSLSPYSNSNNNHYEELEALGPVTGDLSDDSILIKQLQSSVTGLSSSATAGVITTRASARAFLIQGTNRALFRFTMLNHLCNDLEQIKDNSRTPDRVHQDVARSPGGDSQIYLNSCVGCHAGMDGLLGAYAYLDLAFTEDGDGEVIENTAALEYTPGEVQAKYLINSNNFKQGFITTDDSWINYWRNGPNALLGWNDYPGVQKDAKGHSYGNGPKSMGKELAYSDAFAQCQVKKAFKAVCFRDPDNYAADRSEVSTIVGDFVASGYKMKQVFRDVAAYCKGN